MKGRLGGERGSSLITSLVNRPSPIGEERVSQSLGRQAVSVHGSDGDDGKEDSLRQEDGLQTARVNQAEGDLRDNNKISTQKMGRSEEEN